MAGDEVRPDIFPSSEVAEFLNGIHPVSRETLRHLECYRRLLTRWQATTNLVARNTLDEFWSRHVADSLQCVSLSDSVNWLDLGSGAGFPGLVIAFALAGRGNGETSHYLVESNRKKCAFLREAARAADVPVNVTCERIETALAAKELQRIDFGTVTARALAPLPKLLDLASPVLQRGGTGLFHKGREFSREVEDSRGLWSFDLLIHESRVAADSVILEIRNLSPRTQARS